MKVSCYLKSISCKSTRPEIDDLLCYQKPCWDYYRPILTKWVATWDLKPSESFSAENNTIAIGELRLEDSAVAH